MELLKGKAVSDKIKEEVQEELGSLQGDIPYLAIVRIGEKADDISYEKNAIKKVTAFGMKAESYTFPEDISDADFKAEFAGINKDPKVTGILLMRPFPEQIVSSDIELMIDPIKDLDGISPVNAAKVFAGDPGGFAPCTAEAVIETLKAYDIAMSGKRVTIVGRSLVVGRPLSMLLLKENATVTIAHTKTEDLKKTCRDAQLLITAAGRPKMFGRDYVGKDSVVIDVGINVDDEGNLCGDVDIDDIEDLALAATPVPGGIGTVTTAVLAKHLIKAALKSA